MIQCQADFSGCRGLHHLGDFICALIATEPGVASKPLAHYQEMDDAYYRALLVSYQPGQIGAAVLANNHQVLSKRILRKARTVNFGNHYYRPVGPEYHPSDRLYEVLGEGMRTVRRRIERIQAEHPITLATSETSLEWAFPVRTAIPYTTIVQHKAVWHAFAHVSGIQTCRPVFPDGACIPLQAMYYRDIVFRRMPDGEIYAADQSSLYHYSATGEQRIFYPNTSYVGYIHDFHVNAEKTRLLVAVRDLVYNSLGSFVELYDISDSSQIRLLQRYEIPAAFVVFSPDGHTFAAVGASFDNEFHQYDTLTIMDLEE